jgi:hypothetical protein
VRARKRLHTAGAVLGLAFVLTACPADDPDPAEPGPADPEPDLEEPEVEDPAADEPEAEDPLVPTPEGEEEEDGGAGG